MNTSTLIIFTENTSTGETLYYADFSILYWYLGIMIVILILILFRR